MEMSKSQFAAHIGVSPSRITAMIATGVIGSDAMVGEGRSARIIVERALEQVGTRRHVGQALANGLNTRIEGRAPAAVDHSVRGPSSAKANTAHDIQIERLAQERRKNRLAEIAEAERLGKLVSADSMQAAMAEMARHLIAIYDGMVPDLANELAAQFQIPSRDAIHLVRRLMNERRAVAAEQLRRHAETLPEAAEVTL